VKFSAFNDGLPEKEISIYISFPPLCHRLTELNSDLNMGLIGQVSAKSLREGTLREES